MEEEQINELCKDVIKMAEHTIKLVEIYKCNDKQWFLDYLDKLNEISVKY